MPAILLAVLFVCTVPPAQNRTLRNIQIVEAQEDDALDEAPAEMPDDLVVVFTCDHCTPCSIMDHSGDPVPVAFYTHGMVRDDAKEFSETGCAHGYVGRIRSSDIVPMCLDMADRTEKFGS